jgi:hypothetical protein
MSDSSFCLSALERRAYAEDGFFIRKGVFVGDEIDDIRDAVECCAARASAAAAGGRTYQIDGNVYCEASGTTIQFEHSPGTKTVRVIEPFHHLDERIDRLIDDPRLVDPIRGLLGEVEVSLFTDKLNLKRPGEGSRYGGQRLPSRDSGQSPRRDVAGPRRGGAAGSALHGSRSLR